MTPLQVRLPDPLRAVIKGCAKRAGQTESEAVRELIVSALSHRRLWPPGPVVGYGLVGPEHEVRPDVPWLTPESEDGSPASERSTSEIARTGSDPRSGYAESLNTPGTAAQGYRDIKGGAR